MLVPNVVKRACVCLILLLASCDADSAMPVEQPADSGAVPTEQPDAGQPAMTCEEHYAVCVRAAGQTSSTIIANNYLRLCASRLGECASSLHADCGTTCSIAHDNRACLVSCVW